MNRPDDQKTRFRVAHLNPRQATPFSISPDPEARAALAAELGLIELPKLSFTGKISAEGRDAWRLVGDLRAEVVQPCVVTLGPVRSKIAETVQRDYSPHITQPEDDEVEIPEDDLEPLGQYIDADAVMAEALSLALPLYPRAKGAELPSEAPEEDEDDGTTRRPFAGLADLLKKQN